MCRRLRVNRLPLAALRPLADRLHRGAQVDEVALDDLVKGHRGASPGQVDTAEHVPSSRIGRAIELRPSSPVPAAWASPVPVWAPP